MPNYEALACGLVLSHMFLNNNAGQLPVSCATPRRRPAERVFEFRISYVVHSTYAFSRSSGWLFHYKTLRGEKNNNKKIRGIEREEKKKKKRENLRIFNWKPAEPIVGSLCTDRWDTSSDER